MTPIEETEDLEVRELNKVYSLRLKAGGECG